jgi:hypothetical protein
MTAGFQRVALTLPVYGTLDAGVVRLADGKYIAADPTGADWQDYQAWLNAGNAPLPADPQKCAKRDGAAIDAIRDARLAVGFADTVTGKIFQTDSDSIARLTALGSSAGLAIVMGQPATQITIIAADNSILTLTAADAFALLQGRLMPWVSATMLYARALKNQVAADAAPDVTQGWP